MIAPFGWRFGRKQPRNQYLYRADNIDGLLIGQVDTPELSALVNASVNAFLEGELPDEETRERIALDAFRSVTARLNEADAHRQGVR
jgi:hypothetical protein